MKTKDKFLIIITVVTFTWLLQNILMTFVEKKQTIGPDDNPVRAGQSFLAPKKEQLIKPLMTEVEYCTVDTGSLIQEINFSTKCLSGSIQSNGAVVQSLGYRRDSRYNESLLYFIDADQPQKNMRNLFLIALAQETPLHYQLQEKTEDSLGNVKIILQTKNNQCTIKKEFLFSAQTCAVDLTVEIEPHNNVEVQPRIFFSSPMMRRKNSAEYLQGIYVNEDNTLERKKPEFLEGRLWVTPTIFGTENQYFVTALVNDQDNFVQRAYYKAEGLDQLVTILEGPVITEKMSWHLRFYCGPKQTIEFSKVNSRLDKLLYDGWVGPLSKFFMRLLNLIYEYVHNYGLAILLLTLLIKLLLFPFTYRAEATARRATDIRKKLQYLEQKYKDEPDLLAQAKTDLYRKSNPLDMGCIAFFVQIPILLSLNRALSVSIELYGAPFFGWIHDLSAIDPYYVFPALTGIGLFFNTGTTADPRQRLVSLLIALVVTGVMSNLAVGLVLFICASTWLGIIQNYIQKAFKI